MYNPLDSSVVGLPPRFGEGKKNFINSFAKPRKVKWIKGTSKQYKFIWSLNTKDFHLTKYCLFPLISALFGALKKAFLYQNLMNYLIYKLRVTTYALNN